MSILDKFKKANEEPKKKSLAKDAVEEKKVVEKKKTAKKASTKKASEQKTGEKKKKAVQIVSKKATQTLIAPIISEKTARLSDQNVVVFKVATDANKVAVRNAFRELYKVTPVKVNIMNVGGHSMRFGRTQGRTKDYKKALVMLPKGTRVDIFEGV